MVHTFSVPGVALILFSGTAFAQYAGYATYSNRFDGVCGGVSGGLQLVSMNAAQFGGGSACGQCVLIKGTGHGAGSTPVSTSPFTGVINNVCPQCGWGDLELQAYGNGRYGITWQFVTCPGWGRKILAGAHMGVDHGKNSTGLQGAARDSSTSVVPQPHGKDAAAMPDA